MPALRERPASVTGIGAFVDLAGLHAVLKDHHDTGLITGRTWPSTAIALLGLPLLFAQHVDDTAPVRVMLLEGGALVVAIALRNADLALATATSGSTASWKRETVGVVDVLRRLDGVMIGVSEALGVCRNTLLASTDGSFFERAGDVARYAATPEAEGFAVLVERAAPARFGAVVRGASLRDLVLRALGTLANTQGASLTPLLLVLSRFAFGAYENSEIPLGFTADPATATLDVSLPDRAQHLGLSPIAKGTLLGLPAGMVAAACGDRHGGPIDLSLPGVLLSGLDSPELRSLVAAVDRRALAPLAFTMTRTPTGHAFVMRLEVTQSAGLLGVLEGLVAGSQLPAATRVEKLVLAPIGEVYKIAIEERTFGVAVRGTQVTIALAAGPFVALAGALEPGAAVVETKLPRSLAARLPDPSSAALAIDLDVYAPPNDKARKVGPGALLACVLENDGRAVLRVCVTAAGWRAMRRAN